MLTQAYASHAALAASAGGDGGGYNRNRSNGKGGGKGGGKGAEGAGKGAGAVAANVRSCINCGSKDHLTAACPKPEVPRDQRPCWKCGKLGHLGRDCPGRAKAVNKVDEKGELILWCFGEDGDWRRAGKNGTPVPPFFMHADYMAKSESEAAPVRRTIRPC